MRVLLLFVLSLSSAACALPRWPVDAPLSSPYGLRFLGFNPDIHKGVDIPVPVGTPVHAMKAGKVEFAGEMRGYGNVIILSHGPNVRSIYAHLSRISVRTGDKVRGRQEIALSGQSGNASGPHLHFEVERWGRQEDPVALLGGPPRNGR